MSLTSLDVAFDATAPSRSSTRVTSRARAASALRTSATLWFVVALIGQLIFATYVAGFYGRAAASGNFETWNKVLPHGYVHGDTLGNATVASHLLLAIVVILGGALQLVPAIRRKAPTFHRWNGRVYLFAAAVMSLGGLVMVWTRGAAGDWSQHLSISVNALLIIAFGAMALRCALMRRFDLHRRWALRLFLAVGGVWFFRIGLMLWIVANQGPVGFDPNTFTGPALTALAIAQYAVPLAVLQLYFRAERSSSVAGRLAMSATLGVLTLLTAAGIAAATMIMWLPRL